MRWAWLLGGLLFLASFAVGLALQAPAGLVTRLMGASAPPALAQATPTSTALAGEISALEMGGEQARLTWQMQRLSLTRLGPVYRVGLSAPGLDGTGEAAVAPHRSDLAIEDATVVVEFPNLPEAWRRALFRPLGEARLRLTHVVAEPRTRLLEALDGTLTWRGAAIELAPEIALGDIEAQLSAPRKNRIHAEISNSGGVAAVSGTATLMLDGASSVDLLVEPRPDAPEMLTKLLERVGEREGRGWRLRRSFSTGERM